MKSRKTFEKEQSIDDKMEYNYKISIIIPTYNREKYLKNLIDSLIAQTIGFDNLEVILVDDCSTDNSKSIIKNYASKYNNIKPIFLEKNTGNPSIPWKSKYSKK